MHNLHTFRYIHVQGKDMYVHVCAFMNMCEHVHTCLYHVQTRMYRFAQACPGGQDSRWYVLVCTALYLHSTRWYKVVHYGTRWYKVVQTTVYGGTWRYKAVRESFISFRIIYIGWYILACTDPYDSIWVCCPAAGFKVCCCNSALSIALYWRLQHLIAKMQAQECFNQPRPALPPIRLPPLPLLAGDVGSAGFSGGAADSAAGAGGGAGTAAAVSAGPRWCWCWCCQRVLAWDHWWVGHGSSLGDELAGQVLGRWMSPTARFLEDIVVECCERVTELCPKLVRGHGIRFSS